MKNPDYKAKLAEIREVKREMKASGIRITSCMNGGLSREEYSYNSQLFRLKTELMRISPEISA